MATMNAREDEVSELTSRHWPLRFVSRRVHLRMVSTYDLFGHGPSPI